MYDQANRTKWRDLDFLCGNVQSNSWYDVEIDTPVDGIFDCNWKCKTALSGREKVLQTCLTGIWEYSI